MLCIEIRQEKHLFDVSLLHGVNCLTSPHHLLDDLRQHHQKNACPNAFRALRKNAYVAGNPSKSKQKKRVSTGPPFLSMVQCQNLQESLIYLKPPLQHMGVSSSLYGCTVSPFVEMSSLIQLKSFDFPNVAHLKF